MLTNRQEEVLKFIRDRIKARGYGPTIREMMDHIGINSPNGMMCHLKALEKKGFIVREKNLSRGISLTEAAQPKRGIPLINLSDITE